MPYIEFLFVRASLWLRLPSDPSSQRRPCHCLAVGVPSPAEDFHLRERAHARRTIKTAIYNLIERGEILHLEGKGVKGDPKRYGLPQDTSDADGGRIDRPGD